MKIMSATWLCLKQTSQLALFVIFNLTFLLNKTYTFDYQQKPIVTASPSPTPSPSPSPSPLPSPSPTAKLTSSTNDHINTLNDDIERAEFLDNDQGHTRRKRLIWITDDGRLALPPGTTLTITPTIGLPLVRHPPEGFFSNVSISFPLTIDFDKLGLTDNQNPLGDLPPIFARSFGYTAGEILTQYLMKYLHYKRKRDLTEQENQQQQQVTNGPFKIYQYNDKVRFEEKAENTIPPTLPERFQHTFHGGERVILYGMLENLLSTFGLNGKACLLRTICEIHSRNLQSFGVFGEMVKVFLTATNSPFAKLIPDYVKAQEIGEGHRGPGECFPYYKDCPKSIFKDAKNHKYKENFLLNQYYEHEASDLTKKQQQLPLQKIKKNSNINEMHKFYDDKKLKDYTTKIKNVYIM